MQITGLEIHQVGASLRGNWIFVQLHTDAGLSGLGEASQSGNDGLVVAALQQLGEKLQGADPTQVEVLSSMRAIVEEFNTAAIYITHDLAVVAQMADVIKVLRYGEEVEEADTRKMLKNAKALAGKGDYAKAVALANKAKAQGEAGQRQAVEQEKLWRSFVVK